MPPEELLDLKGLARTVGLTWEQVMRLVRSGRGPRVLKLMRGNYRVRRTDWDAWLRSREITPDGGDRPRRKDNPLWG